MNKDEIITKIENMFERLRDNEYTSWYNRSTLSSWENSIEYPRYMKLIDEERELIDALSQIIK